MNKQVSKKVAHRIEAYFVKNNITSIKLRMAQTLPSTNIVMEPRSEEETEMLRGEDGQMKVLESKAELAQKQYRIIAMGIPIPKIDLEKTKMTKKNCYVKCQHLCWDED